MSVVNSIREQFNKRLKKTKAKKPEAAPQTEMECLQSMRWRSPEKNARLTFLRRQHDHRASCIQGYRAKGLLVQAGKGHNTLAGIPAVWLS